jgi:acyl-CoA dehydrogenase
MRTQKARHEHTYDVASCSFQDGSWREENLAVFDTLRTFIRKEVHPIVADPAHLCTSNQLQHVLQGSRQLGLLPDTDADADEESGIGLWQGIDNREGLQRSIEVLCQLAQANTGIAYAMHLFALGSFLCQRLSLSQAHSTLPVLQLGIGMGRDALPALLADKDLTQTQHLLLRDCFIPEQGGAEFLLQAPSEWKYLLLPHLEPTSSELRWGHYERGAFVLQNELECHGLQEIKPRRVSLSKGEQGRQPLSAPSSLIFEAMGLNALGLIAIAKGSCNAALEKAATYAGERQQGGSPISQHAAVQHLLGQARLNSTAVDAMLRGVGAKPQTLSQLNSILSLRAAAHPLLCQAATDALQVLGGYGYMRDYGMEKILRDNEHLKNLNGTPSELRLFLGSQEV